MVLKVLLQNLDAWPASGLGTLTPQERQEAAAMAHPQDARRKAAARAWLRAELGHALGMPAQQVPLRRSDSGKPAVDAPLAFNLSHSGAWGAIALLEHPETHGCAGVGVDLETWSQADNLWEVRDQFLHPTEVHALASLSPAHRDRQSLLCWTRKEAVLKALGVGLLSPELAPVHVRAGISDALCAVHAPRSQVVSCRKQDVVLSVAWQGSTPLSVVWP
jgi:4'-phosphopantetheinyl transferase